MSINCCSHFQEFTTSRYIYYSNSLCHSCALIIVLTVTRYNVSAVVKIIGPPLTRILNCFLFLFISFYKLYIKLHLSLFTFFDIFLKYFYFKLELGLQPRSVLNNSKEFAGSGKPIKKIKLYFTGLYFKGNTLKVYI